MVVSLGATSFLVASCSWTNSSTTPTPQPENDKLPPNSSTTTPQSGDSLNPVPTPSVPPQSGETSKPTPTPSQPAPAPQKPQAPTEPAQMMTFTIDARRTSGLKFNEVVQFKVVDAITGEDVLGKLIDDYEDPIQDGIITFELPDNRSYKVIPFNFLWDKYEYPPEVIVDKEHPKAQFRFEPIIQTTEKEGSYRIEDVAHEIPFETDVLGNPISLRQNKKDGKMSIFMYMKTSCLRSRNSLKVLNKAIGYNEQWEETPDNWNKVEVYCFSDDDSPEDLIYFKNKEWAERPQFHFIADPDRKMANAFFHNNLAYPRFAFIDYEGVYVERIINEIKENDSNLKTIRRYLNTYSRGGNY